MTGGDKKKHFSVRQYGNNLRASGRWFVTDKTGRRILAGTGAIGAAGGLGVALINAENAVVLNSVAVAQNTGKREQTLKTAEEQGVQPDARTLKAILDVRNDEIAKTVASQKIEHADTVFANLHPEPVAVGAVGLPLLLVLASALPESWVKKQRKKAESAAGTQGQGRG